MKIVWDERKRLANLSKLGFDFADLTEAFFVESAIAAVQQGRHMAVGRLQDGILAVIFVFLGREGISVISMRAADRKERAMLT
jgi:uncharacterized DUF497 family protein